VSFACIYSRAVRGQCWMGGYRLGQASKGLCWNCWEFRQRQLEFLDGSYAFLTTSQQCWYVWTLKAVSSHLACVRLLLSFTCIILSHVWYLVINWWCELCAGVSGPHWCCSLLVCRSYWTVACLRFTALVFHQTLFVNCCCWNFLSLLDCIWSYGFVLSVYSVSIC